MSKDKNVDTKVRLEDELTMKINGPMYIDPKHKKPGFHYILPTTQPGNIEYYERLGYVVVKEEMPIGDQKAAHSSPLGAAVTINSRDGIIHVLMACSDERFEEIEAVKAKIGKDRMKAIGHIEGVSAANTYGSVTLGKHKL
jgi:hypothetical protein